ncbi:1-deoxy-D-xylulose-5-phosphate synthase [Labeo rohita]|uniref:1-deoxy-D-xylulose-5-phosphate synthase n=1 Tax=Labeo rohita TaxID=84645 RepID=A0ABQ8LRA9_LABRO|nr:1-deoxy-D-xylulose-5-phosphate synthase [Labeo rohita]
MEPELLLHLHQNGLKLSCLSSALRRLTNAYPPTCSCLLICCCLAAPSLTLSPPSVRWVRHWSASLHRHYGWRIACLHHGPSCQRVQHGSSVPPLCRGPIVHWLHRASCLGLLSFILCLGTPLLWPCPSVSPAQATPFLRLHLGPLLLQLHRGLPDPSVAGAICSTSVLQILLITLAHWLSVSTSGSYATCSTAVDQPPGVVSPFSSMAPPSVGSTIGYHHCCGLGPPLAPPAPSFLSPSGPAWSLLLSLWLLPPSSPTRTYGDIGIRIRHTRRLFHVAFFFISTMHSVQFLKLVCFAGPQRNIELGIISITVKANTMFPDDISQV